MKAPGKHSGADSRVLSFNPVQKSVPNSDCVDCHGQRNSSSLQKQAGQNPISGDVHSAVWIQEVVPPIQISLQVQIAIYCNMHGTLFFHIKT